LEGHYLFYGYEDGEAVKCFFTVYTCFTQWHVGIELVNR